MGASTIIVNHRVVRAASPKRGAVSSYRLGYIATRPGAVAFLTEDDRRLARQEEQVERELGYIGFRPGVQLPSGEMAPHALFDQHGIPDRREMARELRDNQGAVITSVVSVRLEDAEGLGLSTRQDWERLLRSHWQKGVERLGIMAPEDIRWVAAVHRNGTSIHAHVFTYDASGRFDSLIPMREMEDFRENLTRQALGPAREALNLVRTQARDELVHGLRDRLTEEDRERIRQALPPSGSLKYASLSKTHPESKEAIDRVVAERVSASPELDAAMERYVEAAAGHAKLRSLEGARLQAHMEAARGDIAARLGNAAISESRTEPRAAPEPPEYDPGSLESDEAPSQALRKREEAFAEEASACLDGGERLSLVDALRSLDAKAARDELRKLPSVRAAAQEGGFVSSLGASLETGASRVVSILGADRSGRGDLGDDAGAVSLRLIGRALGIALPAPKAKRAAESLNNAETVHPIRKMGMQR